jgi:fucose 4-O-acetylase-like acetyltransferase
MEQLIRETGHMATANQGKKGYLSNQTSPDDQGSLTDSAKQHPAHLSSKAGERSSRLHYVDNLRWVMIMLVLSMHAAVTYSHLGSWYFMEKTPVSMPETFIFGTYQAWLQSFFMGFLFFIAGYFVPKAYDTKGPGKFLKDRAYRLGLPLLFFVFVIQPVSIYCIYLFDKQVPWNSFGELYARYIHKGWWMSGTGPLWFCEALLIFCAAYALFRIIAGRTGAGKSAGSILADRTSGNAMASETIGSIGASKTFSNSKTQFPGKAAIWGFIALIAGLSFLVRFPWPNGTDFYNLQICNFSQYVCFFSAGILAYRRDWLRNLSVSTGKYWGRTALIGGMVLWIGNIVLGGAIKGNLDPYHGGLHWQSLLECCREQLVGVGLSIFLLVWFREGFNRQGKWARFFSANAFAVYVFHTPILIALSKMMIGFQSPLLLKFLLLTLVSIVVTYVVSAGLLRKIPLLKNIL